jgi:Metal-dependent hydrolases of the beta-lactamase superfamily II
MKTTITILSDNQAGKNFESEHGLSWLVEASGMVLLDTGASDLFIRNAQRLNIDLSKVDNIVLSHGHWDHGNGLTFLENKTVTCHPEVFRQRFSRDGTHSVGLSFTEIDMEGNFPFANQQVQFI